MSHWCRGRPGGTSRFSPSSIRGSGSSTLSILTSGSTPVGNYTATIAAIAGPIVHVTQVTLAVSDFSISIASTSRSVVRGSTTSYTVTLSLWARLWLRYASTWQDYRQVHVHHSSRRLLAIRVRPPSPYLRDNQHPSLHSRSAFVALVGIPHSAVAILTVQWKLHLPGEGKREQGFPRLQRRASWWTSRERCIQLSPSEPPSPTLFGPAQAKDSRWL